MMCGIVKQLTRDVFFLIIRSEIYHCNNPSEYYICIALRKDLDEVTALLSGRLGANKVSYSTSSLGHEKWHVLC